MAEYLASIFGTEKDKVNCSFYFKIGACRHGESCSRVHAHPSFSQTVLLKNLYRNPRYFNKKATCWSGARHQEEFDDFFEEVFVELEDSYGQVDELNICDNISEHLSGNTYVKFRKETAAEEAVEDLNCRWFSGQPISAELSPVSDFREACCRQYETGECSRGGFCNFLHLKPISRSLLKELYNRPHAWRRSRSPRRRRKRRRRRSHSTSCSTCSSRSSHDSRSRGSSSSGGSSVVRQRLRERREERSDKKAGI